jgi:hypothetical protein
VTEVLKGATASGVGSLLSFGGEFGDLTETIKSGSSEKSDFIYIKNRSKSPFDFYMFCYTNGENGTFNQYLKTGEVAGTQNVLREDSGYILRGRNVVSEFFDYDVYGFTTIVSTTPYFPKVTATISLTVEDVFYKYYNQIVSAEKNAVSNPSFDGFFVLNENPTEICVGDLTPPVLENVLPASGSHLSPLDSNISFDIVDPLGGVDLSSLFITVSGEITVQTSGIYTVVISGVSQVPYISVSGNKSRYSVNYNPPLPWDPNETVHVNVFGMDMVPEVGGEPFTCISGSINNFAYNYLFYILDSNSLTASITGLPDVDAPYLSEISPSPDSMYVDKYEDISFNINDDGAGVKRSTLNIYLNNINIVSNGVSQIIGDVITITSVGTGFSFNYNNTVGFEYGSVIEVRVVVQDNYEYGTNILDYTYSFETVSDNTLEIENFEPQIGITRDLESVDISVYIHDDIYDVDQINLYLSINGVVCPSVKTPVYGIRNLTSTVSGISSLSGVSLYDSDVSNAYLSGVSISYPYISGGSVLSGACSGGLAGSFPDPFANTVDTYLVYGDLVSSGIAVSGTITPVLVSGVNWDGKTVNSSLYGVDLTGFYSTASILENVSVSGTIGSILTYHPPNDFNYGEPINVLVHAENFSSAAKIIKEQVYQLLYGYDIRVYDRVFRHNQQVDIVVRAFNKEDFTNYLNSGFYFTTIDQSSKGLTASITGIAPWEDLRAEINPQAPIHRYGKVMSVSIYAKDLDGNELGPYVFYYTIEEGP